MELTKNLAQWRGQTPGQWVTRANRVLPPLVIAVCVVFIATQAADLLWAVLDRPTEQDAVPPAVPRVANTDTTQPAWSLANAYGLFGQAPTPEAIAAVSANALLDAPPTDLNMTLSGLLVAQELPERGSTVNPEAGAAIIAVNRNPQRTYWTSDPIDGVNNATLYAVFEDRVVLDRGGRYESLYYRKDDDRQQQQVQLRSSVAQRAPTAAAAPVTPSVAISAAEQLTGIAETLGQVMSMQSHNVQGEVIGMRLQPKGDSEVFTQLGFEPGDILLEVNGLRVSNLLNAQAISQALAETDQASIRIRRNEQDQAMIISLADIQRLTQSRQ